jgi:signal transduction histidine kinase
MVAQEPPALTVLAIHMMPDDERAAAAGLAWSTTLRRVLAARVHRPVDVFQEQLPVDRLASDDAVRALLDYFRTRYATQRPDIVIAGATSIRDFAIRYRDDLFPQAPIVAAGSWIPDESVRRAGAGVAVVPFDTSYTETLELALRLHPSTRRVYVLMGRSPGRLMELRPALERTAGTVPITYVGDLTVPDMLDMVRHLPSDSLVFYINYNQQTPGRALSELSVARLVGDVSPVPVYGILESQIGLGIVGGAIRTSENEATQLAVLAARILNGERAQDLPIEPVKLVPTFDWRQLKRWSIAESRLPAGSDVRFREPTVWERYRWLILGLLGLLALQTAMIVGLVVQRARRREIAARLAKSEHELARVARLTALGEFASSIAHEVRQPLTAIISSARASVRFLTSGDTAEAQAALSYVLDASKRADAVIERNRELFRNRAVQKERLDVNAIVGEAARMARPRLESSQVSLATSLVAGVPEIEGDRIELQQVLLNLIVNAVEAMEGLDPPLRQLRISTALDPADAVRVSVRDNGVGLDGVDMKRLFTFSYTTKPNGTGVGLPISRSIIEAHGGRLWAEPNDTGGATFTFAIPAIRTA